MGKKKRFLVLGVVLLLLTVNFVVTNRTVLFYDLYGNGSTIIELEVASEVDMDRIKEIIHVESNVSVESMKIENKNDVQIIRTEYIDQSILPHIGRSLKSQFGDQVKILGSMSMGKSTRSFATYATYLAILLSFVLSLLMIIRNVKFKEAV